MNLAKLLSTMETMEDHDDCPNCDKPLPVPEAQRDLLQDFVGRFAEHAKTLKIGDYVERNELGKKFYMRPRDGELAVVESVFAAASNLSGKDTHHGRIATVVGGGAVMTFPVDFRYYRRVPTNPATYSDKGEKL